MGLGGCDLGEMRVFCKREWCDLSTIPFDGVCPRKHGKACLVLAQGLYSPTPHMQPQSSSRRTTQLLSAPAYLVCHRWTMHRDLKPSNLLLDEHGQPCVNTFGLVRGALGAEARAPWTPGRHLTLWVQVLGRGREG